MSQTTVRIAAVEFSVTEDRPFLFGRSDADGVVGLDTGDKGISAIAGSVEWAWGMWWVVNRSRKRRLLLDNGTGGEPQRLECGQRFAIGIPHLSILVTGAVYTHRIEIDVPEGQLARIELDHPSSDTVASGAVQLSDRDKDAVVALFAGYLADFPRRQARPRTYQEAAELLGPPWTKLKVRKQLERLKDVSPERVSTSTARTPTTISLST